MNKREHRSAFTLIELLVVIAIIAILSVVVILTLNPAQLLEQSRDSNRLSDLSITNTALGTYLAEGGNSLGSSNLVYISVPDPAATSSAGDNCQGLNLPAAPSSSQYFCGSSSTYRNTDGTGWIPVNFQSLAGGSPIGQLPKDPINTTSTGLYYTYATNGTQYMVTAIPESQKYLLQYEQTPVVKDYPGVLASGNNLTISQLFNPTGLVGWWPFEEGSGSTTADASGNGNNGTWSGTPIGSNNTYYAGGKIGNYSGDFDGATDYMNATSTASLSSLSQLTVSAWVEKTGAGSSDPRGTIVALGNNTYLDICNSIHPLFEIDTTAPVNVQLGTCASTGVWANYVGTYNGSVALLYMNGVQIATGNQTGTVANFTSINVGRRYTNAMYTDGFIDDVRVYNRALSASEVMALYNAGN
jgi:prepilin-type N-terminal cleavage/methylation domain-containing protein